MYVEKLIYVIGELFDVTRVWDRQEAHKRVYIYVPVRIDDDRPDVRPRGKKRDLRADARLLESSKELVEFHGRISGSAPEIERERERKRSLDSGT